MLKNVYNLFEIFGFKIRIDLSWLLIASLIVWNLSTAYFPHVLEGLTRYDYLFVSVISMLGMFISLILHELAHSLVARYFGLNVGGITLFLFGGVAELEQEPRDPGSEFWIAIVGPLTSFALAGVAYSIASMAEIAHGSGLFVAAATYLGLINLVLAFFNLVPAFPLDGGRVLRAFLWKRSGDLMRSTRIASQAGSFFAIMLIVFGSLSLLSNFGVGGLWQILIGFFILTASRGSYQQLLVKHALENQTIGDLMSRNPIHADVDQTIEDVVENIMLKHNCSFVPVTEGEHLLGYIDTETVHNIDRENWSSTRVSDIYQTLAENNVIPADMPTEKLFEKMAGTGRRKFLIAENGKLLGVISLSDLMTYLAIRQGLGLDNKS